MRQIILFLSFLAVLGSARVYGQTGQSPDVVSIDGKQYILHQVEKGETIFSLCEKYNIEQKELVGANPQLIFGLKEADSIKIPYRQLADGEMADGSEAVVSKSPEGNFKYYVVKKGETVYSLSKQFNLPIESIYRYNPEAKNELLENEIIRIPLKGEEENVDGLIREDGSYFYHQVQAGETIYSLSKRYNKPISHILQLNPFAEDALEIGAVLRIEKDLKADKAQEKELGEEGAAYFIHRVESGDTFFSYKRRFGVTEEQLVKLNPQLSDGLLAGLKIKIPTSETAKVNIKPVDSEQFIQHKVMPGENLYRLSQKYELDVFTIKEFNPELKNRGLKADEVIYIPKKIKAKHVEDEKVEVVDSLSWIEPELPKVQFDVQPDSFYVDTEDFTILDDDTFRVSMFLPLFYEQNIENNLELRSEDELAKLDSLKNIDAEILSKYFEVKYNPETYRTDTILVDSMVVKEYRSLLTHSKYFINFYQGFLMGIDSMQKAGLNVRLDVYDSRFDINVVDSILLNNDFINADLIVGPVDVSLQKHVSEFSAKNQIPMVSPFSSNHLFLEDNPFYYQVNPSKEYILRKTSDFIGDVFYDKNFIVMTLGDVETLSETDLVDKVREKLFTSGVYYNKVGEVLFTQVDFVEGGHLGYWQVKETLKPDMENVIFIPATENREVREALLSRAINSLYVLSEEFDITLVGVSDYPNFKSINTEYFHKLKLHYLTPRYVNYSSPGVNRFIADYRSNYYDEPDEYSFRGFDVAVYFSGAYARLGSNFTDKIDTYHARLLQGDYNFQRVSEFGGFMNHTVYVMNFTPAFDVKMLARVSEGYLYVE